MTSRVTGYTAAFDDAPRDSTQDRERRRRRFAAAHKPGDIVYGTPLRPGPNNLTWVDIDGHPLLAEIGNPEGFPLLRFIVDAVEPDIVLKICPGEAAVSPARAAALYATERTAMDDSLAEALWPNVRSGSDRPTRRAAFFQHLAESPAAQERAHAVLGAIGLLAPALHRFAALNRARYARLAHLPWLEAGARDVDCLILADAPEEDEPEENDPDSIAEHGHAARMLYGATLPDVGRVLCEVDMRPKAISARLYAADPSALRDYLQTRGISCLLAPPGARLTHLGPLPKGASDPLHLLTAEVAASRLRRTV